MKHILLVNTECSLRGKPLFSSVPENSAFHPHLFTPLFRVHSNSWIEPFVMSQGTLDPLPLRLTHLKRWWLQTNSLNTGCFFRKPEEMSRQGSPSPPALTLITLSTMKTISCLLWMTLWPSAWFHSTREQVQRELCRMQHHSWLAAQWTRAVTSIYFCCRQIYQLFWD